jgi:hypothetical protein
MPSIEIKRITYCDDLNASSPEPTESVCARGQNLPLFSEERNETWIFKMCKTVYPICENKIIYAGSRIDNKP